MVILVYFSFGVYHPIISMCTYISFCDSDITALAKDRAYAQIRLDELSIRQVIQKVYQFQLLNTLVFPLVYLDASLFYFITLLVMNN